MIPQRELGTTTVRFRVAACRKRLRVIRVIHRAQFQTEIEERQEVFLLQHEQRYDPTEAKISSTPRDLEKAEVT